MLYIFCSRSFSFSQKQEEIRNLIFPLIIKFKKKLKPNNIWILPAVFSCSLFILTIVSTNFEHLKQKNVENEKALKLGGES